MDAMNQHKKLAMGKMAAKGGGQGKSPSYKKGGRVAAKPYARGGKAAGLKTCSNH